MKRGFLYLPAVLLVLSLAGCAQFFEFNLFKALDVITLPTQAELESMPEDEALAYLEQEISSPSFIDKLVQDGQAFAGVESFLSDTMTGSSDPDSRKRAAVLYADLQLRASGGEEVVNNVASLLGDELASTNFSNAAEAETFLEDFIPSVMPASALESRAAFDALLTGFQDAWVGYDNFSSQLGVDPTVPESINMGDVAQKALFSFLVTEALQPDGLYETQQDARDALWDMARGVAPSAPYGAGSFSDPFAPGGSMQNILDVAGLSFQ